MVIVLVPLAASIVGNVVQCRSYRNEKARYLEQQMPQVDCDYELQSLPDQRGFSIRNVGLVDARDVWARETIFAIINDQVYEGTDVPHFNYLVFNGSRTKIWDIPKDGEQNLTLPSLQAKAFETLMQRFQTELISRWTISYSSPVAGKRYTVEDYFLHTPSERMPKRLTDTVGGQTLRNRINDYLASGPKHEIRIFGLTEDFELDPPLHYLIMKDLSIRPIHEWTKLSIEEIQNSFMEITDFVEPEIADDTTGWVQYIWNHKDGRWSKFVNQKRAFVVTKSFRMLWTYLTPEDAERVKKDPSLLGSGKRNPEREREVQENAKQKYIQGRISFERSK